MRKQLAIHHVPAKDNQTTQIRIELTMREGAQPQVQEIPFAFSLTQPERVQIQWYLEQYLIFPWGEFRTRAQGVEELMERKGVELFQAIFRDPGASALYARVADDLANTRIVIHADDPEGISLPWELMRDPVRHPYGDLAGQAYAFVRSQPEAKSWPMPSPLHEANCGTIPNATPPSAL